MKFKKINLGKLFEGRIGFPHGTARGSDSCRDSCGGACRCQAAPQRTPDATERRQTPFTSDSVRLGKTPSCSSRELYGTNFLGSEMRDRGNEPIVFDIRKEAFMTPDFRTALWTGGNLQLTVMTVPVGEEIGVEMHEGLDQLIGVVSGAGEVSFGNRENYLAPPLPLDAHSVMLVPAGTYHNVKNVGKTPLKLYSVYAPKAHKFGTVEKNKG